MNSRHPTLVGAVVAILVVALGVWISTEEGSSPNVVTQEPNTSQGTLTAGNIIQVSQTAQVTDGWNSAEEKEGKKPPAFAGTPRETSWRPDTINPTSGVMVISRPPIDGPFNSTVTHPWPLGRGPIMEGLGAEVVLQGGIVTQGAAVLSQGESLPPIDEGLSSLISAFLSKNGGTQVPLPPPTPYQMGEYISILEGGQ